MMYNLTLLNGLARELYKLKGCNVSDGFDFSKSRHPEEQLMLSMAITAYDFLEGK